MTNKKFGLGIMVMVLVFGMTIVGCGEECVHIWEWKITTPATETTEGLETETCTICDKTRGTRIIPATNNGDTGGIFTLTGIPPKYNGMYAYSESEDLLQTMVLVGAESINWSGRTITGALITNGTVNLPMWRLIDNNLERFSGNVTAYVFLEIFDTATTNLDEQSPEWLAAIFFEEVIFINGNAAESFENRDGYSGDDL